MEASKMKNEHLILDEDVVSYYPNIILQQGLYPETMGKAFLKVYGDIVKERIAAKAAGDKVKADSLKITVNGSFGKFGSKYSVLYSPDLLIQTTVTGQLALLMLIEMLHNSQIYVVSANTDGIVINCHKDRYKDITNIISMWELTTGFETEETQYRALYSANVNNYLALKSPAGYKLKGFLAPSGLQKNPTNEICVEAVVKFLDKGTPIEETVRGSKDIRKFVSVRKVAGGARKDGVYLGKTVRFYMGRLAFGHIEYVVNSYKVPRTEGAEPCMTLPDEFPCDVDLTWYIDEAKKILKEIGA